MKTPQEKGDAIKEFNKAVNALALELPEAVWNDFHFMWVELQNEMNLIGCTCKTEDERWRCVKTCENKPKIVRS